jgi:hypothetical protein
VKHVVCRHDHADHLVDRDNHLNVGLEQARLAFLQVLVSLHGGGERNVAVVGVLVVPVPLVADRLDRHVGWRQVTLEVQQAERRDGDGDQNQDRHHGPDHFDERVVRGLGRLRVRLGVELDHHVDQKRQNEQRDQRDDDQQEIVEVVDELHHRRCGLLQTQLPVNWLAKSGGAGLGGQTC